MLLILIYVNQFFFKKKKNLSLSFRGNFTNLKSLTVKLLSNSYILH